MTTTYPGAIDNLTNPVAGAKRSGEAAALSMAFDAIEAMEARLGTLASPNGLTLSVKDYGATGNGVTHDTAAIQAALDAADAISATVYFPPGVYLTGTLNYRCQSMRGDGTWGTWIQGLPSQDIFHGDPTVPYNARRGGEVRGLRLIVDDSVDAAASFPQRGGVGNAAFAFDWANGAATQPIKPNNMHWSDLEIGSLSDGSQGQNNSCGIYAQTLFGTCQMDDIVIRRLTYGWWDHWPTSNIGSAALFGDNNEVGTIYFDVCYNAARFVNWGYAHVGSIGIKTGGGSGTAPTGLTIYQAASPGARASFNIGSLWVEMDTPATSGVPLDLAGLTSGSIGNLIVAGAHPIVTIAANDLIVLNGALNNNGDAAPIVRLSGNHIRVRAALSAAHANDAYLYDLVDDTGYGNTFELVNITDSPTRLRRPEILTRGAVAAHNRDSSALMAGYTTPWVSGDDLWVDPRSIRPSTGTEGTNWGLVADATTEFGYALRSLAANNGAFVFSYWSFNGVYGYVIGKYLPAARIRVYLKLKASAAGTSHWRFRNNGVAKSDDTFSLTTSWAVYVTELDLTGETENFVMSADVTALSVTGTVDIGWIMFRPYDKDSLTAKVEFPTGPTITSGAGTPESAVTAPVGSVFLRTDGSTSTSIYIKTSGSGNTGWTAK